MKGSPPVGMAETIPASSDPRRTGDVTVQGRWPRAQIGWAVLQPENAIDRAVDLGGLGRGEFKNDDLRHNKPPLA